MIVLLCVDEADAQRFRMITNTEQAVLAMPGHEIPLGVQDGARVLRTNRWVHNGRAIAALQALATRVQLVDPTGLLGPLDPDRRRPPTTGPTRTYNDPPAGVRKGWSR